MRVVVVGAGPAGMAAARAAADTGASVVLVDAEPAAGGQFLRNAVDFAHPGVTHLPNREVWAVQDNTLYLRGPRVLAFDALVLATGAHDRALPFPGWDQPGVVTAGAAQALAKAGVAVGRRVIVAGTGPFLLPVATTLQELGVEVLAVLDAGSPLRWLREPAALWAGRHKIAELLAYRKAFSRYRVRTAVVAKQGDRVTVAQLDRRWAVRPGTERVIRADTVCVGFGFTPRLELASECERNGEFVRVDERQATSVPGVYAAGEITGIGGADLAAAEGTVAGVCAAGGEPTAEQRKKVRRGRVFAAGLAWAHAIEPGWQEWLRPDTVVCRCEKVSLADLRSAVDTRDARAMRSLKLTSRAGMGLCQGRMCAATVAALTGVPFDAQRRVIATPVPLGELADTPLEES